MFSTTFFLFLLYAFYELQDLQYVLWEPSFLVLLHRIDRAVGDDSGQSLGILDEFLSLATKELTDLHLFDSSEFRSYFNTL